MQKIFSTRQKIILLVIDIALLIAAFALAVQWRFEYDTLSWWWDFTPWVAILLALVSYYVCGAYDLEQRYKLKKAVIRVLIALLLALVSFMVVTYVFGWERSRFYGRGVATIALLSFGLTSFIVRWIWSLQVRKSMTRRSWLVIQSHHAEKKISELLSEQNLHGSVIYLSFSPENEEQFLVNLKKMISGGVDGLIIADPLSSLNPRVGTQLIQIKMQGTPVIKLTDLFEKLWHKVPVESLDQDWFLQSGGFYLAHSQLSLRLKRLFDLGVSSVLLLLTWPFMLLTALAVFIDSPGPVIYSQIRTGRHGSQFRVFKFRSMRLDAEKSGAQWAVQNDTRITRVGSFIRKTRLDELPQLLNVFRGDMSFVGPRPERPEFNTMLAEKIPFYDLRHLVPPGITGWAQILYPYGASINDAQKKLEYDLYYIKNHSLILDFKIILKTIRVVLFAAGR